MENNTLISSREKKIAFMGYCFIALLMLISQREDFKSRFVRMHARYAAILQWILLFIIVSYLFAPSRLFWIPYVVEIVYCWVFLWIFFLIWRGMYAATHGNNPKYFIGWYSGKNSGQSLTKIVVNAHEKKLIIMSHVPFLGTYISAKYGWVTTSWEKFWNYFTLVFATVFFLSSSNIPSMILAWFGVFWIIYLSISWNEDGTVVLLGERLWWKEKIHNELLKIFSSLKDIFTSHASDLSHGTFRFIEAKISPTYYEIGNTLFFIPLFNLYFIKKLSKTSTLKHSMAQGILITLFTIIVLLFQSVSGWIIVLLICVWWYNQALFQKSTYVPIVWELIDIILTIHSKIRRYKQAKVESFNTNIKT